MILECSYCESSVDGKILAKYAEPNEGEVPSLLLLLQCPACKRALLGKQSLLGIDRSDREHWSDVERLWPMPEKSFDVVLPDLVRDSLEEAQRCYRAAAYSACAVMCRRAIEGICTEYKVSKTKVLAYALKDLLNKQIIDKKIYEWGKALRELGNIGAHASS